MKIVFLYFFVTALPLHTVVWLEDLNRQSYYRICTLFRIKCDIYSFYSTW